MPSIPPWRGLRVRRFSHSSSSSSRSSSSSSSSSISASASSSSSSRSSSSSSRSSRSSSSSSSSSSSVSFSFTSSSSSLDRTVFPSSLHGRLPSHAIRSSSGQFPPRISRRELVLLDNVRRDYSKAFFVSTRISA